MVRWLMEDFMDQFSKTQFAGEYANKWAYATGQSEIANIWTSYSADNQPTDAEQKNGLQGRAQVTIHAITRFQGTVRRTMAEDAAVEKLNQALFSLESLAWVDEPSKTINLELRGDQWQFGSSSSSYNPRFPLNVIFKPRNMAEPLNRIPCNPSCNISAYL